MNNSSKFKVGDLALVIGAVHCLGNVGKVVRLVAYLPPGADTERDGFIFRTFDNACWVIETGSADLEVYVPAQRKVLWGAERSVSKECHLMPLPYEPEVRHTVVGSSVNT